MSVVMGFRVVLSSVFIEMVKANVCPVLCAPYQLMKFLFLMLIRRESKDYVPAINYA